MENEILEIQEKDVFCVDGNTKSTHEKQNLQYMNWFFTLNNYNDIDLKNLEIYFNNYCKTVIVGFEVGESGTPHLQGYFTVLKKTRFTEFKKIDTLCKCHIEVCRNAKASQLYCQKEMNIFYKKGYIQKALKTIENLKPWQTEVMSMIENEPNDRSVIWIYEPQGNIGKSAFIKYVIVKNEWPCGFCTGGKMADIVNAVYNLKQDPHIIFFDLPRSGEGAISYGALEQVKNGLIFNSKFESGYKVFNPPHVVIFSNFPPKEPSQLSSDRWKIYQIVNDELICETESFINLNHNIDD